MKKKFTEFTERIKATIFPKKVTGGDFHVVKHWKLVLLWALVVSAVFVGMGVYSYFTLDLLRQKVVNTDSGKSLVVPDSTSVEYMVTQYKTKLEVFNEILQERPEVPDLGLHDVTVEEVEEESVEDGETGEVIEETEEVVEEILE